MPVLDARLLEQDPQGATTLRNILADGRKGPPARPDPMAFVPRREAPLMPVPADGQGDRGKPREELARACR